jgi:hypothetical protein
MRVGPSLSPSSRPPGQPSPCCPRQRAAYRPGTRPELQRATRAAFQPPAPCTPPPGWAEAPARQSPGTGVSERPRPGAGRGERLRVQGGVDPRALRRPAGVDGADAGRPDYPVGAEPSVGQDRLHGFRGASTRRETCLRPTVLSWSVMSPSRTGDGNPPRRREVGTPHRGTGCNP